MSLSSSGVRIDLSCDVGEGIGDDAALMPWLTMANIACGGHAGDEATIQAATRLARANNVSLIAHPGYPDPENFGRVSLEIDEYELEESLREQIFLLLRAAEKAGGRVVGLKPHGALFHDCNKHPELAGSICELCKEMLPGAAVVGLPGSSLLEIAASSGLPVRRELYLDRGYSAEASLLARNEAGAVLSTMEQRVSRVHAWLTSGDLIAVTGERFSLAADVLCLHGDDPLAPATARQVHRVLVQAGLLTAHEDEGSA